MKKNKRKLETYAFGTDDKGTKASAGTGASGLYSMIPQVMDGIIDIVENNPNNTCGFGIL